MIWVYNSCDIFDKKKEGKPFIYVPNWLHMDEKTIHIYKLVASLIENNCMTLEEFENKFRKNKRFDNYWYHGLCFATIGFSLFMLFSLATDSNIKFSGNMTFHYTGLIFLFLFGVYGLYVLRKTYKLSYWSNGLTIEKNEELLNLVCSELLKTDISIENNNAYFIYRKSWWRMPYEVHLFADNNLIALNVEGLDLYDGGYIDFGASTRTRNRILNMIKEKASH